MCGGGALRGESGKSDCGKSDCGRGDCVRGDCGRNVWEEGPHKKSKQ